MLPALHRTDAISCVSTDDYKGALSPATAARHRADLALFASYLGVAGELGTNARAWSCVTSDQVRGFQRWMLTQGYAIGSINVRVATVKVYARLAHQAGTLPADAYAAIALLRLIQHRQGRNLDVTRVAAGLPTRLGHKKAAPIPLSAVQARQLKTWGRPRDRLILCLGLDHGLRASEIAGLSADAFDLDRQLLTFYRPKVAKTQTHRLTPDTLAAARAYLPISDLPLLPGRRALAARVWKAGLSIGIPNLSPHDLRHAWVTMALRSGTDYKALQDAGGWTSPAMVLRYAASLAIANDRVRLDW